MSGGISQLVMERFVRPHPVAFRNRRGRWRFEVLPLGTVAQSTRCWWDHAAHTVAWWAGFLVRGEPPPREAHYLQELVRSWARTAPPLVVCVARVDEKWTVVDGNHRLIALNAARLLKVTESTHVGVMRRVS